jgi:SNF2 family DNA or RNA helicase
VYCPLSALQREVYQQFRARAQESTVAKRNNPLYSSLYDEYASDVYGPYKKALTNVNNLLMQLRKLCNHPFLVLEDVHTIPDAMYYEQLVSASGKLFVLDKLLTKLLRDGSKVRCT